MIVRFLSALILALSAAYTSASPAFLALPSTDTLTLKLLNAPAMPASGEPLRYTIAHWPDGARLTSGTFSVADMRSDAQGHRMLTLTNLKPKLWWPSAPELYTVSIFRGSDTLGSARIGFRKFEARGGSFFLNGRALYLRGMPINPPGRGEPASVNHDRNYIDGYIRLLKSHNVNLIRTDGEDWLNACDELGMLVFQGNYGGAPGGRKSSSEIHTGGDIPPPLTSAIPAYRRIFADLANHPSVVIYVLTNEVASPRTYQKSLYLPFLEKIQKDVQGLDPTRPIIANAGFGEGLPSGGVFDIHRYAGWYSRTMVDWYDLGTWIQSARRLKEPFTISECVGAYTSDAGDFLTMSKQLSTMIGWVGAQPDPRRAAMEYQAELVKQVVEITRRFRTDSDPGVASTMPFTYFLGLSHATDPRDIIQKPAFDALRVAFQPVLISPECWTRNLSPGATLRLRLHIVNDDDDGRTLEAASVSTFVTDSGGNEITEPVTMSAPSVPYYSNRILDASVALPENLRPGEYRVSCVLSRDGKSISGNEFTVRVYSRPQPTQALSRTRALSLYDPSGKTKKALASLGIAAREVSSLTKLPETGVLVLGEDALGTSVPDSGQVVEFLRRGGRIVCLRQSPEIWTSKWLPCSVDMSANKGFTYIQQTGDNAALWKTLTNDDLRLWNQTGVSENKVPDVFPVRSILRLTKLEDLRSTRVWAATDQMLTSAALMEIYEGRGSVLLSQFACADRAGFDPAASQLLANLIEYALGDADPGSLDLSQPIQWGLSAFREGALVTNLQGFLPYSPTYAHDGSSKGRLASDHRIDGVTLVGTYHFTSNGWLRPIPDPKAEAWGVFFGRLPSPVSSFSATVRNVSRRSESLRLLLDHTEAGSAATIPAGGSKTVRWPVSHAAGDVRVELRGGQSLVITRTQFD
ncbi:MAG: hypothetical protein IT209_01375 [Armatimonadetes bacterium]|nr:hypothetical protein [Armatimonadota bacterium]